MQPEQADKPIEDSQDGHQPFDEAQILRAQGPLQMQVVPPVSEAMLDLHVLLVGAIDDLAVPQCCRQKPRLAIAFDPDGQ